MNTVSKINILDCYITDFSSRNNMANRTRTQSHNYTGDLGASISYVLIPTRYSSLALVLNDFDPSFMSPLRSPPVGYIHKHIHLGARR